MPALVVFSYNSSYPRGHIVDIVSEDHVFTKNETLDKWEESGGTILNWPRPYGIWHVTDKTIEELQYLKDPFVLHVYNPPRSDGRKYSFSQPEEGTEIYESIKYTGKFTSTFDNGSHLIKERK